VLSCDKKKELVIVVDGAHGTRLHRQAATRKQIG
jgi:methionine synthase I (cobalamin-dependent)